MKILGTVSICGCVYTVKVGDFNDQDALEHAYGCCSMSTRTLWLHAGMPVEKTLDTLSHEALHGLLGESGIRETTEGIFGATEAQMQAWEEALVRILTPHIMATFGPPQLQKARKRGH